MLTLKEAIDVRQSKRNYTGAELSKEAAAAFEEKINEINKLSGMNVQLVQNSPETFAKSYCGIKNANSFFAMVGKESDMDLFEKTGYYGEQLVLLATAMGLGTCWVSITYDRDKCPCTVNDGEKIVIIIAVGEVAEDIIHDDEFAKNRQHRSSRPIEYMYQASGEVPDWFIEGMQAVAKAPSNLNAQPVKFFYNADSILAYVDGVPATQNIDMGIAEYHFEVATGKKIFNK